MAKGGVHVVFVQIEQLAVDTGLWCNDCMLGSGTRIHFTSTCAGITTLRATAKCTDCGGTNLLDA